MPDLTRIQKILADANGLLAGITTLFGSAWVGAEWLSPLLKGPLGETSAKPVSIILSVVAAFFCLWLAFRAFEKKSKLLRSGRFALKVTQRDDLLGRETTVSKLKELVDNNAIVFVDGESGCGKSSLVAFGLVPMLRDDPGKFPILVTSYFSDWDAGLTQRIFDAA